MLCSHVNELFFRVLSCSSQFNRKILINCSYIVNVLTLVGYRRSLTMLVFIEGRLEVEQDHVSVFSSTMFWWAS